MRHESTLRKLAQRSAIRSGGLPPIPAASGSNPDPEGSPIWHGYLAKIPEGWRALQPVFVEVQRAPQGSGEQDALAAVDQAMLLFQAAILLCRSGADDQAALQEFEAGFLLEAGEVRADGQYRQAAPVRPAYGVLPLAIPSEGMRDQAPRDECLVLLPLVDLSPVSNRAPIAPIMMFVNGTCVYRSEEPC